jgi:hypothetical protein
MYFKDVARSYGLSDDAMASMDDESIWLFMIENQECKLEEDVIVASDATAAYLEAYSNEAEALVESLRGL